jgi:hypothetical protein
MSKLAFVVFKKAILEGVYFGGNWGEKGKVWVRIG